MVQPKRAISYSIRRVSAVLTWFARPGIERDIREQIERQAEVDRAADRAICASVRAGALSNQRSLICNPASWMHCRWQGSVRRAAGSGAVLRARRFRRRCLATVPWQDCSAVARGGGGLGGLLGGLFGRASGGRVRAGGVYMVGENGEPFIAPANGRIVSNGALQRMSQSGASSAAALTISIAIDARGAQQGVAQEIATALNQRTPGDRSQGGRGNTGRTDTGVSVTEFPAGYVTSLTRHL